MADALIELVPYDSTWTRTFEVERDLLDQVLNDWSVAPIEHVGSTAVPGLVAKPVIDIMVGVQSLAASKPAIAALANVGYCYAPYKTDQMHWFCKPAPELRTHHLHLIPFGSKLWLERLRFRDALRVDPDAARRYANLKTELAARHRNNRDAYTEGKSDFVTRILSTSPSGTR